MLSFLEVSDSNKKKMKLGGNASLTHNTTNRKLLTI